jgi:hypothetical protein
MIRGKKELRTIWNSYPGYVSGSGSSREISQRKMVMPLRGLALLRCCSRERLVSWRVWYGTLIIPLSFLLKLIYCSLRIDMVSMACVKRSRKAVFEDVSARSSWISLLTPKIPLGRCILVSWRTEKCHCWVR